MAHLQSAPVTVPPSVGALAPALDLLPLAVVVLDRRQRALLVNDAWVGLTLLSHQRSRGRGWLGAPVPGDRDRLLAALSGGPDWRASGRLPRQAGFLDCRLRTGQGERWGRWTWLADSTPFAAATALCVIDVHDDRRREETLRHDAWRDPLTGVLNRGRFLDLVEEALSAAGEDDPELGVMFADLDGFKTVNDVGGHALGDHVLRDAAERMTGRLRPNDVLGRVGGDEFAILCRGSRVELQSVAARVADLFEQPFAALGFTVQVGLTIGVAMAAAGDCPAALLERADQAMYEDKRSATRRASQRG